MRNIEFANIEKQAEVAADWWASKLKKPKMDNGDNSSMGLFFRTMAELSVKPITDEQVLNFKNDLKNELIKEMKRNVWDVCLSVDYHPCKMLYDIAKKNNISDSNLPIKTSLWIKKNAVLASYGYKGDLQVLYSTLEYWKDELKSANNSLNNYLDLSKYDWITQEQRSEMIDVMTKQIKIIEENIKNFKENENE